MKKIHLFMTMLLTFCGVSMTAALLSLTSIGSTDSVSLPSQLSVEAGGTITVPVSLENSNPNYVGFQMDIVLPQGITPVKNDRGTITPVKTDRLTESHGFSCNFDESSNTLKLVCASMSSDLILGKSGELFSFDLQADASMTSGDYRLALTNVQFTTGTTETEDAKTYYLDAATATLTVTGNEPATKTWTIAGSSELCGSNYDPTDTSNDMTFDGRDWKFIKTGVVLEPNKQYTYRIYANHSTDESYGERDGSDFSITVDKYGKYYVAIYFNAEDIISSKTVGLQEELTPPEEVITLYVKCDTAPFIWSWGAADGTEYNVGKWPGTNQFKNKYKHEKTGEEFWTYTFPKSSCPISFLFNNGLDYPDTKQTSDINSVNSDRWFYLSWSGDDGNVSLEDVTEQYSSAGIPDAEVNSVFLKGNHNNWGTDGFAEQFTAGQDGKSFTYTIDMSKANVDENLWQFKFCPNNTEWLGFWDFFYLEDYGPEEGKQPASMAPSWLQQKEGNFMIDLEAVSERTFTFDLTWGGGKDASKNWTLKATKTGQGGGEQPSAETDLWVGDWYVSWDLEDGDEHKEWKALGQEDFANMQVGQVLYFYFGYEKDATYHQYRFDDWAWEILPGHQVVDIYEDVKVPFVVTQDIKDAIAKMGFAIHGHGFRVTKVTKGKVEEVVETDKVFIPAVSAQAGGTFTLPVSLTNSNANYVGFQMDIVLPQGITPATEEGSVFAPTKTSRLADSHVFSCNFDASTNTLKLVCVSQSADLIQEKSGVLFYLGLKANGSMKSGDYTIALNNVLFTTSSSESEYAHGTTLDPVTATVSVEAAEVSSWTVAGMTEVFGTYWNAADTSNDMTQSESMPGTWVLTKQNVTLYSGNIYEYKVTANHDWYECYGTDGGGNAQFTVRVTGIYNLMFYFDVEKKTTSVTTQLVGQPEAELLDVPAALERISSLASGQVTAEYYRVKGIVDHITESPTTYGNTSFYMVSPYAPNQKLLVYRAYGLNGENLTEETMFQVGDEVEIFGQLQNYQGTTPEMTQYSYLLSVNANESLPQSYYDLCRAILTANDLVSHPALKATGEQLLADAISSAQETLRGNDDASMAAAAVSLNETTAQVQQRYMQPYETVTLVSADGKRYYYSGSETINGQQVTLTPMPANGSQPYLQAANLRLFAGNQLLVKSNENIVKMLIDANITMQASTSVGEWADNQWTGNANEVLLTINKGSYYLYSLTVVYEALDAETLLQRLNEQIAASEQAVQQLAYANVLGASALNTLIAEAKTATVDTEVSVLQNYIKQLQSQTEGVVTLDQQYQMLATLMNQVEGVAQNNDGADATVKAAALDAIQQARTGLNNGAYGVADLSQITVQMNNYYSMLSQVYLTIHVEQAGTLASLIEAKGFNLSDVKGLTVSGTLNSDDMYTLQNSLTGLESLNMSETDVTEIPSTQFRGRTNLMTIVLPKNLETIGGSAFYNCNNLQDVIFPTTLRTIGASAFRYCYAFENVVIPEGVTSIGNYAFDGYNKSGESLSQIKTVSLPSTLTSLGNLVFRNCQNLKSITCKNIVPVSLSNYVIDFEYDSQCTLYVPAIAVSAYQNASYWMNFQIQGTDIMPENIVVTTPTTFEWPATIGTDFRPNIRIDRQSNSTYEGAYGNLTVDGTTTVSMGHFNILWDAYYSSNSSTYNSQTSSYEYNRYAYCSLLANTPMRADQVSVNLWTRSYTWDFLTFPFDVKVSDIQNTIQADVPLVIRRYDGKNRADAKLGETWVNMTGDDILEAGKGYIWQSAANDQDSYKNNYNVPALNNTKKNNIFTTADVTVQLDEFTSEFSQNRSWNLIGNPYPAYYDIRAIQTQAPITVWNKYNQVYQAYSPAEDAYILNPGQAFFIQRPLDEESITFLKEGRQTSQYANENAQYGNGVAGGRAAANKERYVFNLLLSGSEENLGDRTRIVISSQAKADYEAGCDATKFMSPEANAAQLFTTAGNVRYAINERPLMDGVIELGLSIGTAGSYTIALSTKVEGEVYLIDRVAGTEIRLDGSEGYTFQAVKGIMEGRFAIRLGDGEATGISDVRGKMSEVRGETYNLKGQRIANPSKGLYIVNGKKSVVK